MKQQSKLQSKQTFT